MHVDDCPTEESSSDANMDRFEVADSHDNDLMMKECHDVDDLNTMAAVNGST
jgi:hypothetical protein